MNNNILKGILTADKKALMTLHEAFSFDFEQDITVIKTNDKFTVNSLNKMLSNADVDLSSGDFTAVVLTVINTGWNTGKIVAVELFSDRYEWDRKYYRYSGKTRGNKLDSFWRKSDYEDMRKIGGFDTYIIAQHKDLLKKPVKPSENLLNTRFNYKSHTGCVYFRNGEIIETLGRVDLTSRIYNYESCTYESHAGKGKINDCIDKSGYIVEVKRLELQRRATNLRIERLQTSYNATDNTAKIAELADMIEGLKKFLVDALISASTHEEYKPIIDKLWKYNGFDGIVSDFELLKRRDAEKKYKSIKDFESAYESIKKNIEALTA